MAEQERLIDKCARARIGIVQLERRLLKLSSGAFMADVGIEAVGLLAKFDFELMRAELHEAVIERQGQILVAKRRKQKREDQ